MNIRKRSVIGCSAKLPFDVGTGALYGLHVNFANASLDSTNQLFTIRGCPVIFVHQGAQNLEEIFDWATLRQTCRVVVLGTNGIEWVFRNDCGFWCNAMTLYPAKTRIVHQHDVFEETGSKFSSNIRSGTHLD